MITSVVLAGAVGLVASGIANSDNVHAWLRSRDWRFRQRTDSSRWVWTFRTSHPSEWYSALSRRAQYVALHLDDGRRLYGWPDEWPVQAETGHFVISEAEWLVDDLRQELSGVEAILIPARQVQYIEFMMPIPDHAGESPHVG